MEVAQIYSKWMDKEMKAYKGFDKDLKCRGFQYEIGKEYIEDKADICSSGFHACEYPLDVLGYYPPSDSRYCEVDLDANEQRHDDSKRVGKHIKVSAEIGIAGIVKASVNYIMDNIQEGEEKSNTGNWSAATNTGNWSAATVTGKESIAIATGYDSKAKGALGCFIVLADWKKINGEYHIIDVKSAKVDGEKIKPDVFYILEDGKFKEVDGIENT